MLSARYNADAMVSVSATGFARASRRHTLPTVSPTLLHWFTWYSQQYLRRHFHSVRVSRAGYPPFDVDAPLIIFANHASWWDPLLWLVVKAEFFPSRPAFSPIDADALARYKLLRRLGFFGVEQKTARGAFQFLRTAEAILHSRDHILAMTPQGRFSDVRERPVVFENGLGLLATRTDFAVFLPMASEFVYWEERLPEILVRFGTPIRVSAISEHRDAESWTRLFEEKLRETQDALALEAQRRTREDFHTLLRGSADQGGVYDWYRALKAKLLGQHFTSQHGDK